MKLENRPKYKVIKLEGYRKKELGTFINRIGFLVSTNTSYQAPDLHELYFPETGDLINFFEYEVKKV